MGTIRRSIEADLGESAEHVVKQHHPCSCCGHLTRAELGSYDLCPVCGWEDAAGSDGNPITLWNAQRNFAAIHASHESWRAIVRPASAEEARPPDWLPLWAHFEARRQALLAQVRVAFSEMRLGHGISLKEAVVLDGWGGQEERSAARKSDERQQWSRLAESDFVNAYVSVGFLDGRGLAFYLPALIGLFFRERIAEAAPYAVPWQIAEILDRAVGANVAEHLDAPQLQVLTAVIALRKEMGAVGAPVELR